VVSSYIEPELSTTPPMSDDGEFDLEQGSDGEAAEQAPLPQPPTALHGIPAEPPTAVEEAQGVTSRLDFSKTPAGILRCAT